MGVIESATRLFDLVAVRGAVFTRFLQPGLSTAEIERLTGPVGLSLPPEVREFYSHFDFPSGYFALPAQPTFDGLYSFYGLADAVEEYQMAQTFDFLSGVEKRGFPLLREADNGYLVDTIADSAGNYPVAEAFHGIGAELAFSSLTAMFDTFHAWLQAGVWQVQDGYVSAPEPGHDPRESAVAAGINPGVPRWQPGAERWSSGFDP